jgi:plastocyanin
LSKKPLLFVLLLCIIAAAIAANASGQRTAVPKLNGTVGPGYTITLKQSGKVVKTLKAGTYTFVIADKSSFHSFGLDGPHGFAKDFTTVPYTGTKTATVKLKAGTYKYYCVAHEATMFAHFTVK